MNRGRMSPAEVKAYLKESDTTLGEMLKFVFGSVLKRKSLLVLNVVLLVIIAGLNFVVPQFTQHVIDHAVALKEHPLVGGPGWVADFDNASVGRRDVRVDLFDADTVTMINYGFTVANL